RTTNLSARALPAAPAVETAARTTATATAFMSGSGDRRGSRSVTAARDEVAVPVEAVLRNALERRVVDVDDPEALRVPVRPLEVVEQAPDEVALHGNAVGHRA